MIARYIIHSLLITRMILNLSLDTFRWTILSCSSPWLCHKQCFVFLRQNWTWSRNYRPGAWPEVSS